jgi:uncharacterized protein YsxB (DUF464 family)
VILVHIRKTKENLITHMSISGHAEYATKGKDLVCAAVSAIGVGGLNTLDKLVKETVTDKMSENSIVIDVITPDDTQQNILKTMLCQLETVECKYSKYIQITKQEV